MKSDHVQGMFSAADLAEIEAAVARTEKLCSIEIVPYVVEKADAYEHGVFKALIIGLVTGYAADALITDYFHVWSHTLDLQFLSMALGGGLFSLLHFFYAPFSRLLIGRKSLDRRAMQKAERLFLSEEVFSTKFRTGILLLVCLFEHRVVILCDAGVYTLEEPSFWKHVSDTVAQGLKRHQPAATFLAAISMIAERMKEKNIAHNPADENELSNKLRMET